MISLTDFFDAASRRHNDVVLLPAIRRASGTGNDFVFQQDSAPCSVRACTVEQCCVKKRQTFPAPNLWLPKQPRSHSYRLRDLGCHEESCLPQIHSVDELKRQLIDIWCGLEQPIFDEATDQ